MSRWRGVVAFGTLMFVIMVAQLGPAAADTQTESQAALARSATVPRSPKVGFGAEPPGTATPSPTVGVVLNLTTTPTFTPTPGPARMWLSPASGSYANGQQIDVAIIIDTASYPTSGADAILFYDNTRLQYVSTQSGGAYTSFTVSRDTNMGKILIIATMTSPTDTRSGVFTLGTIRFNAIAGGTAHIDFDFTPGSRADTDVWSGGQDILGGVQGAVYSLSGPTPVPTHTPTFTRTPTPTPTKTPGCVPDTEPPAPGLIWPPDGASVETTTPNLDWADAASSYCVDQYNIQIYQEGGEQVDIAWPTSSSYTIPAGKLVWGQRYGWWVWAHNSLGFGGASARSFRVGAPPVLDHSLFLPVILRDRW